MKRLFITLAAIVVLLGIVVGVYFIFFNTPSATLTTSSNPFGSGGSGTTQTGGEAMVDGATAGTQVAPRLTKIANGPVAEGAVAISRAAVFAISTSVILGTSTPKNQNADKPADTEIRYIDRASGNVYSYFAHARTLSRISNKTLPGIQEASWLTDGSRAYARFLGNIGDSEEHISTYALSADGSGGYALEQDLSQAVVFGTSTLLTVLTGTTGSIGSIARADGTNSRTLFSSVLGSILVYPTAGNIYAATKASSALTGYGFSINKTSGAFSRILGGFQGLSILPSPDGSMLLYSYVDKTVVNLALYDVTTHTATALPVATLTEKCVWAQNGKSIYCGVPKNITGNIPDDWYQGATSFTDRLWKIDLQSRTASLIVDPSEVGKVSIDAVALTVDRLEDVLVFTDRVTGSIWFYDL